ncbi:hypothetical protein O181_012915 [Austropuccinia psidii MF-1]|uniref:Reverse transcriptase Ty1/copia-type domain-containing protein n=1 Tax=Austropuccinia psidii MF-1 TaxID=1389203 RepID=A0A9Q3GNE5_9BASI|nr:hypothetical protein [Austropuccinia psidii MF-1]
MFPAQSPAELSMHEFITTPSPVWPGPVNLNSLPIWGGHHCAYPRRSASWFLWDPVGDRQIQFTRVIFPRFQSSNSNTTGCEEGLLSHIVNTATLGQVPMEHHFENQLAAIDTLPVTTDIAIPEHLGQVLSGPLQHKWKWACKAELEQMALGDVWEAVDKEKTMKTIRHRWVFNIKHHADGSIEKFKACLVARGDRQ